MHFAGIKIGSVARFPGCGLFSGNEIGVGHLFTSEISLFEVALNPFRCCIGTPGFDQVFADFRVPHVTECVLGKAAFFAPWLDLEAEAMTGFQQRLNLLAYGGEVSTV